MKVKLKLPPPPRPAPTATRRSTVVVDTRTMDELLTVDRARAPLGHHWFAQQPAEEAIESYIEGRRQTFVRFAAALSMTGFAVALLLAT